MARLFGESAEHGTRGACAPRSSSLLDVKNNVGEAETYLAAPRRSGRSTSIRLRLPAFADWFCVAVDVDVPGAIDAFLHRFGRVSVFFLERFEERPEERQRKKTPVHVSQRRFRLDFLLLGARGVTDRQSDRETKGERAQDGGHGVFAQEKLGALAGHACFFFRLRPSVAGRRRNFVRGAPQAAFRFG